jgi:hypothetical protein
MVSAILTRITARGGPIAFGLAGAMLALAVQAEDVGGYVLQGSKAAELDSCVEDTKVMRRQHFELIKHQRDVTVYGGIRSTKHSLSGCVSCHVVHRPDGQPVPIHDEGQFCEACHDYAAVHMNCFDCHATVPAGEAWNRAQSAAHVSKHRAALAQVAAKSPHAVSREEDSPR